MIDPSKQSTLQIYRKDMNQMKKFLIITTVATLLLGIASSTFTTSFSHLYNHNLSSFQIVFLSDEDGREDELF